MQACGIAEDSRRVFPSPVARNDGQIAKIPEAARRPTTVLSVPRAGMLASRHRASTTAVIDKVGRAACSFYFCWIIVA